MNKNYLVHILFYPNPHAPNFDTVKFDNKNQLFNSRACHYYDDILQGLVDTK